MNEDTVRSETLSAVAGDSLAVVKMPMLGGVELELSAVIEACREVAVRRD